MTVGEDQTRPSESSPQVRMQPRGKRKMAEVRGAELDTPVVEEKTRCGIDVVGARPSTTPSGLGEAKGFQENHRTSSALPTGAWSADGMAHDRTETYLHGRFEPMPVNRRRLEDQLEHTAPGISRLSPHKSVCTDSSRTQAPSSTISNHMMGLPETRASSESRRPSQRKSVYLRGFTPKVLEKDGILELLKAAVQGIQSGFDYAPAYFGEVDEVRASSCEACDSAVVTFKSETSAAVFLDACRADPKSLLVSGCQLTATRYVLQTSDSTVCAEDFLGQIPQDKLEPKRVFLLANVPPKWRREGAFSDFFADIVDNGSNASTNSIHHGKLVSRVYLRPECSAVLVQFSSECLTDALFYRCRVKRKEMLTKLSSSTFICRHRQLIPLLGHRKCEVSSLPPKSKPSAQATLEAINLPVGDERSSASLEQQLRGYVKRALGDAHRRDSLRQVIWLPGQNYARIVFNSESTANAFMSFYVDCTPEFGALHVPLTLVRPKDYVRPGAMYAGNQEPVTSAHGSPVMDTPETDLLHVAGLDAGISLPLLTGALNEIFELALARTGVLERRTRVLRHLSLASGDKLAVVRMRNPAAAKALCLSTKPLLLASQQLSVRPHAKRPATDTDRQLDTGERAGTDVCQGTAAVMTDRGEQKIFPEALGADESGMQSKWMTMIERHGTHFQHHASSSGCGEREESHGTTVEESLPAVATPAAGPVSEHDPGSQPWCRPHEPVGPYWHNSSRMSQQPPPALESGHRGGWIPPHVEESLPAVATPAAGPVSENDPGCQPWCPPHEPVGPYWQNASRMSQQPPPALESGHRGGWIPPQRPPYAPWGPPGRDNHRCGWSLPRRPAHAQWAPPERDYDTGGWSSPHASWAPPGRAHPGNVNPPFFEDTTDVPWERSGAGFRAPPFERPPRFCPYPPPAERPGPQSFPCSDLPWSHRGPPAHLEIGLPLPPFPEGMHPTPFPPNSPFPGPPQFTEQQRGPVEGQRELLLKIVLMDPSSRDVVTAGKEDALQPREVRSTIHKT